MKNVTTIIIFFCTLLSVQNVISQEYYIKYGVNDCANCNAYLHQLSTELNGKEVSILFPERFERDSSLMIKQLGLAKFNYSLVFDDSLYKHLVKGEESYFIYLYGNNIFKTKLKEFDLTHVRSILQADQSVTRQSKEVCVIEKNSDDEYYLINDSIIISTSRNLNRLTFQDLSTNKVVEIIPDTSWTRMAYQKLYGKENHENKFNIYLELQLEQPSMATSITYFRIEGNILYIYASVKTWAYKDSLLDHVSVMPQMVIFTYDISTKKILDCLIIPSVQGSEKYNVSNIGKFIKSEDFYYFFIMEGIPSDTTKVLARYKQIGNKFVFDKIVDFTLSSNYIKYKLGNNFSTPIINDHVFTLQLSDKIYDISTGRTIKIPISDEEYESLNGLLEEAWKSIHEGVNFESAFFSICSISDKGDTYGILFKDENNDLFELLFEKETCNVLKKQNLNIDASELSVSYHPQNNNQMIYYNSKDLDGCFHIIDL